MIRELQVLDRELSRSNTVTVLRSDYSLFERSVLTATQSFLKTVEKTAKKEKLPKLTLIATLSD